MGTTANLYSHLEYNTKVISAETIARVLDGEAEQQSKALAETVKSEEKSTTKKSDGKTKTAKKTLDTKSASKKSTSKITDNSAPKKRGRKKKSDTPVDTGESQVSRL